MQFSIVAILLKLFKLFLDDGTYMHIRCLRVPPRSLQVKKLFDGKYSIHCEMFHEFIYEGKARIYRVG